MNLKYTNHANVRCQQRGIPKEAIEFIYKHGSTINTHEAKKYFCNKKKLRSLYFKEKDLITKFDKQTDLGVSGLRIKLILPSSHFSILSSAGLFVPVWIIRT